MEKLIPLFLLTAIQIVNVSGQALPKNASLEQRMEHRAKLFFEITYNVGHDVTYSTFRPLMRANHPANGIYLIFDRIGGVAQNLRLRFQTNSTIKNKGVNSLLFVVDKTIFPVNVVVKTNHETFKAGGDKFFLEWAEIPVDSSFGLLIDAIHEAKNVVVHTNSVDKYPDIKMSKAEISSFNKVLTFYRFWGGESHAGYPLEIK